jgi:hypothetical protein
MDEKAFKKIVTYLVAQKQIVLLKLIVKTMLNLAYKKAKMNLNVTIHEKDVSHFLMNSSTIKVSLSKKDCLAMLLTLNNFMNAEKLYLILEKMKTIMLTLIYIENLL